MVGTVSDTHTLLTHIAVEQSDAATQWSPARPVGFAVGFLVGDAVGLGVAAQMLFRQYLVAQSSSLLQPSPTPLRQMVLLQ
jgi:hypothetical protein